MKSLVRKLLPQVLLDNYRRFNRHNWHTRNRSKTVEQVFTEIYEKNQWGGSRGEFCSGSGSDNEQIVSAYTSMIYEQASREGFSGLVFVDLGCGDFRIGQTVAPAVL